MTLQGTPREKLIELSHNFDNVQWRGDDSFICNCTSHDDKKASLEISLGNKDNIIFHCFAGCSTEKILASKGLTFRDISSEKERTNVTKKHTWGKQIACYDYINTTGQVKLRKYKYVDEKGSKNFPWQRYENGNWQWGLNGLTANIYGLNSIKDDDTILFTVEGEKDQQTISELGFPCVTLPNGGSQKSWDSAYDEPFRDRFVYILGDNDETGRGYQEFIATHVHTIAKKVYILNLSQEWTDIPSKADITDFLQAYGKERTLQAIEHLCTNSPEWTPFDIQTAPQLARNAAEYTGNLEIQYLYEPYFPYDQYTDVFGKSGTGKTFFVALVCAATTTGRFPTETKEPGTVLYISGEESFEEVADRISRAGGDLSRVNIIDRCNSVGLNFDTSFDTFAEIVKKYTPNLLVCDPWQCFCGERIDLNRQNQTRPLLQKVSLLAKETHCAIVFIAHMNKSQFLADANDGLSGSGEIINAARSAIRIIEDETDQDCRIAVHTKATHAKRGQSLKYRFLGNRIVWDGFSEITKETLEQASRNRKTPLEALQNSYDQDSSTRKLITALMEESQGTEICGKRLTYDDFKLKYGDSIFNGQQPKRAIDSVISSLAEREITVKTGIQVRRNNKNFNGFFIQRVPNISTE